jgi:hypothetical protein
LAALSHYAGLHLNNDRVIQPLNLIKGTVIILGYLSWIFNFIALVVWLILVSLRKSPLVARWMIIVNVLILLFQIYYFFFDRS